VVTFVEPPAVIEAPIPAPIAAPAPDTPQVSKAARKAQEQKRRAAVARLEVFLRKVEARRLQLHAESVA
jgi:hypothetical protein